MYRFGLEPVLNHRKLVEDNLQREVATVKKLLADEKRKLRAYRKAKDRVLEELQHKQRENPTVSEILLYVHFLDRVSREVERQKERVLEVEKSYDQKREDLVEAMKKKKTLEKLKEKRLVEYRHELGREEQKQMNEVGIGQYIRNV